MEKSSLLEKLELECVRVKKTNGRFTLEAKKLVCQIAESENRSWYEIGQELGVCDSVVRKWPMQLMHNKVYAGKSVKLPESEKIAIVRLIESGNVTQIQAADKYTISVDTIRLWLKKYSLHFYSQPRLTKSMAGEVSKDQSEESAILQSRIEQLEKALSEERLKVESLQTMIKVAEQELNIGIRKKFGAKQSES